MKTLGHSLPEVKRLNRIQIKDFIYRNAPTTRVLVAKALGLTLPTITTNVASMLEEGLLLEHALPEGTSYHTSGGRKPLMLQFNPDAAYGIGIELGPYQTMFCITNLLGNPVIQKSIHSIDGNYSDLLNSLKDIITELRSGSPGKSICGVGVGLPGFIESNNGIIRSTVHPTWNKKNLADDLSKKISLPVVIDNNVRMRAAGEAFFSSQSRPDTFAYFFISKGIACPLTINNDVVSGYTAGSGELGHTVIKPYGPVCPICGNAGCLEAVASESSILRFCSKAIQQGRAPLLTQMMGDSPLDIKMVLHAQESGDETVCSIMHEAVTMLGISLANVVNLINPGSVLVDGYIMNLAYNRELLARTASQYFYGLNEKDVHLEFLPFDMYRGARGSSARALRSYFIEI